MKSYYQRWTKSYSVRFTYKDNYETCDLNENRQCLKEMDLYVSKGWIMNKCRAQRVVTEKHE